MDNKMMYYSDEDLELLKQHFAENEKLLKLLRKVFVPSYLDTAADIGGITNDMFNHPDFDIKQYNSLAQAFIGGAVRRNLVQLVEQQLLNIKMLAGNQKETVEQTRARLLKDSTK